MKPVNINLDIKSSTINKLMDVLANACGTVYEPKRLKRMADAKAYEIRKLAEAETKAEIIKSELLSGDARNIFASLYYREAFQHYNVEDIAGRSVRYLAEKDEVSDEPVSQQWSLKFFDHAKNVTEDELKEVWAKILAEEVAGPGAVSLKTISLLSDFDSKVATVFNKICRMTFMGGIIIKPHMYDDLKAFGIHYSDLMLLRFHQLLYDGDHLSWETKDKEISLQIGKTILTFKSTSDNTISLPLYRLTPVGMEIFEILDVEPDRGYIDAIIDQWREYKYDVSEKAE